MDTAMRIETMFKLITDYHKVLGHNRPFDSLEQRMQSFRNSSLGLMMELSELVDSMPWKPWRSVEEQNFDKDNAAREIVDILFFLVSLCEEIHLTSEDIEKKFHQVLANNYARLDNGYSLVGNKYKEGGDNNG